MEDIMDGVRFYLLERVIYVFCLGETLTFFL